MPPYTPPLDEHGFPIPPTFDGPVSPRRSSHLLRRVFRVGLMLAFIALLAGSLYELPLNDLPLIGGIKGWLARRSLTVAQQKHARGDVQGALADADRAAMLAPNDPLVYNCRARLRLEANDVTGSLEDFDQLVRLAPRYAGGYLGRSIAYQRLERHREAIDDLTKAISLSPGGDAMPRNNRAYARALAGIELDDAMSDVRQALSMTEQDIQELEQFGQGRSAAVKVLVAERKAQKAAYLDTRGYIFFLQQNFESALADLDEAIQLALDWQRIALPQKPAEERAAYAQQLDHELSVMYHHRGQVLEKLGREEEAQSDLDQAEKLGYNPALGVF
ncbi:MAG TPA: hypothetical protein VNH11_24700 [Pirellulales bacterium]|nr:hypothetical protein [Pirellulales bacterium]